MSKAESSSAGSPLQSYKLSLCSCPVMDRATRWFMMGIVVACHMSHDLSQALKSLQWSCILFYGGSTHHNAKSERCKDVLN